MVVADGVRGWLVELVELVFWWMGGKLVFLWMGWWLDAGECRQADGDKEQRVAKGGGWRLLVPCGLSDAH